MDVTSTLEQNLTRTRFSYAFFNPYSELRIYLPVRRQEIDQVEYIHSPLKIEIQVSMVLLSVIIHVYAPGYFKSNLNDRSKQGTGDVPGFIELSYICIEILIWIWADKQKEEAITIKQSGVERWVLSP